MPQALDGFVASLRSATLVSADDVETALRPQTDPTAESLIAALREAGKLTPFQAEMLAQGTPERLTLGNYLLLQELGHGGMGTVYQAMHRRMKRSVAIKIVAPELLKTTDCLKRFQREVEVAARLEHPNIVTAYDADEAAGTCFLAMQFVDGRDLSSRIKDHGPLRVPQAVDVILQSARGLAYAHEQGVIHRDVKPANLLVDRRGVVKILDLGLASLINVGPARNDDGLTSSGMVMGTVDFMAPEQAVNTKHVDARADIYSLGVTLFYLLAGRHAYDGETVIEKILAHREQPIPSLTAARPDVPAALDIIFRRMVAKRADERYGSMAEVMTALESLSADLPQVPNTDTERTLLWMGAAHTANPSATSGTVSLRSAELNTSAHAANPPDQPGKMRGKLSRRWQFALGTVVALALVVAAAVWFSQPEPPTLVKPVPKLAGGEPQPAPIATPAAQQEPTVATESTDQDIHHRVVEMVLRNGGSAFVLGQSGKQASVSRVEDVPEEPFVVESANLHNCKSISESDFRLLGSLPYFKGLDLLGSNASDAALQEFRHEYPQYLTLSGTAITDASVSRIVSHGGLRYFHLGQTKVTDAACRELAKVPQLRYVELGDTAITDAGLSEFANHPALNTLLLSNCKGISTAGVRQLRSISSLQTLSLNGTDIGDEIVDVLAEFSQLRVLDVYTAKLSKEAGRKLQRALPKTVVFNDMEPVEDESRIAQWVLDQGGFVLGQSENALTKPLPKTPFSIGNISFPYSGGPTTGAENLVGLRAIRHLDWPNLKNADEQAQAIGKLDRLQILHLRFADISAVGIKRLTALTQLDSLAIRSAAIDDAALAHLASFSHLESLELVESPVTDAGLVPLTRITGLERLGLIGCPKLTAQGIGQLATLRNLRYLDLQYAQIDDSASEYLGEFSQLRLLKLGTTHVTAAGISKLKSVLPHCAILWDGGAVIPPALSQTAGYALEFNGKDSYVDLPLRYDGSHPITLEATIQPYTAVGRGVVVGDARENEGMSLVFPTPGIGKEGFGAFIAADPPDYRGVSVLEMLTLRRCLHVAGVFDGKTCQLYVDGKLQGSDAIQRKYKAGVCPMMIGAQTPAEILDLVFSGIIDELRISKTARYTEDFTPKERFEPDDDTLALYHFDEGQGNALTDSSGHKHHGKIVNAKWVAGVAMGRP